MPSNRVSIFSFLAPLPLKRGVQIVSQRPASGRCSHGLACDKLVSSPEILPQTRALTGDLIIGSA
jgi:hypothetical protein